jgi:hypothetical protein
MSSCVLTSSFVWQQKMAAISCIVNYALVRSFATILHVSVASALVSGVRRKDSTELISSLISTCFSVSKIA